MAVIGMGILGFVLSLVRDLEQNPCPHSKPSAFSLPLEVKQNKTKSKDIKQVSVKLKTGKEMITLAFYLLFLQAKVILLDIVVKNENLL